MTHPFTYVVNPARILFGEGSSSRAPDEVRALGCSRALVLSTPSQRAEADRIAAMLGDLAAGTFCEAVMHTPVHVTDRGVAQFTGLRADCVLAIGGGSTIGLGKAIAWRTDCPQIVIATTYAGSEVTPILGQTENDAKTTLKDARVLPETVIYDPLLTLGLPQGISVTSGLNAMAHAVEALYARDRNPFSSLQATEGIRALRDALGVIVTDTGNRQARAQALYGSWLCGTVLGAVGMALHHKLCHTIGGSCDLPHAATHAVLLPHTAAFNAHHAADQLCPVADLFGGTVGPGLWDFARSLGAPMALRDIGLARESLDDVARLAVQNPYWNPRPIDFDSIRHLLQAAWEGARPA